MSTGSPLPDGSSRAEGEPTFDVDAAVPDIIISNDAYHPEKYAAGVRHEFRDIQGIQPNQAYVAISAGGVIIDGATDVHFEVRVQGSAFSSECYDGPSGDPPAVEFRGTFTRCTFDPPRP